MFVYNEIKPIYVTLPCVKCGEELKLLNSIVKGKKQFFNYICSVCTYLVRTDKKYPCIEYHKINNFKYSLPLISKDHAGVNYSVTGTEIQ